MSPPTPTVLLDSNVLIYASRVDVPEHTAVRDFLLSHSDAAFRVSEITRVEVLGYHGLTPAQREVLSHLFMASVELPITPAVGLAVDLRRDRQGLRTADALIAATALHYRLPLVTRNVRDFEWIAGLTVVDPVAG